MSDVFRAAVIGCGRIGSAFDEGRTDGDILTHAGAYHASESTQLIAVCDADAGRAREAAQAWGVSNWFSDHRELLAQTAPALVSVCTPDDTHESVLLDVISTSTVRGVLAEKPLASSVNGARRITDEAVRRGVTLAVNYSRRFAPTIAAVRDRIQSGAIGEVVYVTGFYGKGLFHNGSHWIDLVRYLVGEPEHVRGENRLGEDGPDPSLDVELRMANGAVCRLVALDHRQFTIFEMDILGTAGRIRLTDSGHTIEELRVADSLRYAGYRELARRPSDLGAMERLTVNAVEDLVTSVRDGRAPRCSGEDGVRALQIAAQAAASASGAELRTR